jgi:hypothetical protein
MVRSSAAATPAIIAVTANAETPVLRIVFIG